MTRATALPGRPAYTATRDCALPDTEGPFCRSLGCSALPSLRSAARTPGTRGGTPWNERTSPARHIRDPRRYTLDRTPVSHQASPGPTAVQLRISLSSSPITHTGFAGSLSPDGMFYRADSQRELDADSVWHYLPSILRSGHIRWGMLPSRKAARARISPVLACLRSRTIVTSGLTPAAYL